MLLKETLILSVQGVLQRIPSDGIGLPQIVVPVKLVPEVLRLAHDELLSGHQGSKKTLYRALHRFWWPTDRDDVIKTCLTCARRMPACPKARAPMRDRSRAMQPMECIEMDIK